MFRGARLLPLSLANGAHHYRYMTACYSKAFCSSSTSTSSSSQSWIKYGIGGAVIASAGYYGYAQSNQNKNLKLGKSANKNKLREGIEHLREDIHTPSTAPTPRQIFNKIYAECNITESRAHNIRNQFIKDMEIGLTEPDSANANEKKSSLKMLQSNVTALPDGTEKGVFYTLDWGGSNYRVIRMEFMGDPSLPPITDEYKTEIEEKYKKCDDASVLFDYLALKLKKRMEKFGEGNQIHDFPVGFTFSFPMHQPTLEQGVLLQWTKGFDIAGVPGKDVAELMNMAFDKNGIPARVCAMCNDTVGTLLSCAHQFDNVRIGLILGTGSNACYIEPSHFDIPQIINIEWGNFDKYLPRTSVDVLMDEYTPNPGKQFAEKMISGYYLGELTRLVCIECFGDRITECKESPFNERWGVESKTLSKILTHFYDDDMDGILKVMNGYRGGCRSAQFNEWDAKLIGEIARMVKNRSADLAAVLTLAALHKTGLYQENMDSKGFTLCDQYISDKKKKVVIGVDGSVYKYVPRYKSRMFDAYRVIVGKDIANRIEMQLSADGSGKGAALAVAAQTKNNKKSE